MSFNEVVEEVQKLSVGEKEELKSLLEKYLVEERRKEMHNNYLESKATVHERIDQATSDIERLKRMIDEE